jgi:hypothetical protein
MLVEAKQKSDDAGVDFSLALIPSKERVYADSLFGGGYKLPDDCRASILSERNLVAQLLVFCEGVGIKAVDLQPYVSRELDRSKHVYKQTSDGHPDKNGYRAYAAGIYDGLLSGRKGKVFSGSH